SLRATKPFNSVSHSTLPATKSSTVRFEILPRIRFSHRRRSAFSDRAVQQLCNRMGGIARQRRESVYELSRCYYDAISLRRNVQLSVGKPLGLAFNQRVDGSIPSGLTNT